MCDMIKRKKERFILYHGWTDDDLTNRSYNWIKANDKSWLRKYKRQLRLRPTYDDECNHLVRILEGCTQS